jgi:hypothetical protein
MRIRLALGAIAVGALAVLGGVVPAQASTPQNRVLELRDECDPASFNAEFGPGFCTRAQGSVSLDEFREELADGGSGAWWIRQRAITLDEGDTLQAKNVGGIVHTFTEVSKFGKGCIPEWNTAISETVDNCDFGTFLATIVPQGTINSKQALSVGVHKFECLVHPWMRTVVTVKS